MKKLLMVLILVLTLGCSDTTGIQKHTAEVDRYLYQDSDGEVYVIPPDAVQRTIDEYGAVCTLIKAETELGFWILIHEFYRCTWWA